MNFQNHKLGFENLAQSAVQKLKAISTSSYWAIAIIVGVAFLNYGRILTTYVFNNDGISRINTSFYNFSDYTEKGRWAYAFVYHIFNSNHYTPFLSGLIVISLLTVLVILIWNVFEIKAFMPRVISGALFLSFPIFIHYFFYTGDAEVYASGMLLMLISLAIFKKNNHKISISVIALNTIALGCYPGSFSFLTTLFLGYALMSYRKSSLFKQSFEYFWKGLLISVLSLTIYFIITKFFITYYDLKLTDYKNAASISVSGLIAQLPNKLMVVFELFGHIYLRFPAFERAILLFLSLLFMAYTIPRKAKWYTIILTPVIWFALLIYAIFSTYFITFDTHLYVGYIFGFLLFLVFLTIAIFENIHGISKTVVVVLFGLFIFKNIQSNNVVTITHELNYESSKLLANNILLDIQKLPSFNMKKTPVVFLGYIGNNPQYNFQPPNKQVRVLNNMYVPVGFKENRAFKLGSLFYILYQGVNVIYNNPEWEQEKLNEFTAHSTYPQSGSVFFSNDTVFVKLGN